MHTKQGLMTQNPNSRIHLMATRNNGHSMPSPRMARRKRKSELRTVLSSLSSLSTMIIMMTIAMMTTTVTNAFSINPSCIGTGNPSATGMMMSPSTMGPSRMFRTLDASTGTTTTLPSAWALRASAGGDTNVPSASASASTPPTTTADFEYQELKIQLQAMKDQDVTPSNLSKAKRDELMGYARAVVKRRPSLVPLNKLQDALPGTAWRLAFSTQPAMAETLPRDATIRMSFGDGNTDDVNWMDYSLNFAKTLGLKRINARSTYSVDSSRVNPGLVSIVYDSITTDVFGLQNLGVGMFGMLKGRATYIPTAYFDGTTWIEQGTDPASGDEYYNVYTRE